MKRILCFAWIMAFIVLISYPGIAEVEDPVVVRVGDITFTKSQVQSAIDSDITLLEALEQPALTEEEKQAQRDNTIERFIGVGLIEMKLREAGKNDFTKEEEENLKAAARNQYEQLWQGLWQRAKDSGEEFTEDQITEFMEDEGYTSEAIYEEYKNTNVVSICKRSCKTVCENMCHETCESGSCINGIENTTNYNTNKKGRINFLRNERQSNSHDCRHQSPKCSCHFYKTPF